MKYLISIVIIILAAIVQLSLGFSGLIVPPPNLLLVYLCLLLMVYSSEPILWLALLAGLLLDFFSGFPDGIMLIALPFSIFLARYLGNTLLLQKYSNYLLPAYVIFSSVILQITAVLIQYAFFLLEWTIAPSIKVMAGALPLIIIWNLLTLPVLYSLNYIIEKIQNRYWSKSILS